MAQPSKIEWTEFSWNPVTGCTKVSAGCANCYAERMAHRLQAMGVYRYRSGFNVRVHPDVLEAPLKWCRPRVIFVNSMSDLFHKDISDSFIKRVFNVMNQCPQHTFQVLTKRSNRLADISDDVHWTNNIWMGVTVENKETVKRVCHLRKSHARVKFISCEPLLGAIPQLGLAKIDWVIVGGESGPNARPMKKEWATAIRDECVHGGVPYFFKQWGGWNKKAAGRVLDGRLWDQMPSLSHEASPERTRARIIQPSPSPLRETRGRLCEGEV